MAKWNIDPDHSVAAFSISHLTVSSVHGQMNSLSGTIDLDPDDISSLKIDLKIALESIITGIKKRDDHLKSEDFFETSKYPEITYKNTDSVPSGTSSSTVTGNITIHGIQKKIIMEVSVSGPVKSPFGETTIGITGRIVLDREDFGINWNEPLEDGGFMVGKDVEVSVSLEADLVE